MYELICAHNNSYYIESPAKIGLVKVSDNEVILIDSGNDKDAAKKVNRILQAEGWSLRAIYNTHSNADHIGGNKYLQTQTGCKIFAPGIECDFTVHPILEPAFLYGAFPQKAFRHKFLLAQESNAEPLTSQALPSGFELIPLPGHFFDMVGIRTPDDVVYLADALSSKATLDKYAIGFIYDIAAYLDTLEKIKTMKAKLFVPSHAEPTEDIRPLADHNIQKVNEIAEKIIEICAEPSAFEVILQKLFCHYGLKMSAEQYLLVGSTVRSYLSWLCDTDRLEMVIEDNMLKYNKGL